MIFFLPDYGVINVKSLVFKTNSFKYSAVRNRESFYWALKGNVYSSEKLINST